MFNASEYGAVKAVMAYDSDAYEATRQYADDGSEILQKPVSYLTWMRGDSTGSTLKTLVGGTCYLIYVVGDKTTQLNMTVTGVPRAPAMTWRDTTKGDFVNLVGFMLSTSDKVLASKCLVDGPYGSKGTIYEVSGTNNVPNFKAVSFMGTPKIASGRAYGATAERSGNWGGVIGFASADKVVFGADDSQASVAVKNDSSTNRIFRFTVMSSSLAGENFPLELKRQLPRTDLMVDPAWTNLTQGSTWDVELAPGKSATEVFSINRLTMPQDVAYGAVLVIDDLSGTQMRVRVPIIIIKTSDSTEAVKFPVGLWSGFIQLEAVSRLDDPLPVKAGGTLKMSVMMHVAPNGAVKLLQRVAAGVDTNGAWRLFKELENVPASVESARRFSTIMMSIDNPVVEKTSGTFGDSLAFDWTVAERAADNPFRHAWHPDHDGKKADYSGPTPSGDDLANYANIVKPELWSITNRMEFSWRENNDPHGAINFERTPTEKTAGFVTWTVSGLTAKEPIRSVGVFVLQRAIKAAEVEN